MEREHVAIADAEKQQMKEKRMKIAASLFEAMTNPAEILKREVRLTMAGVVAAVERQAELEGVIAVPLAGGHR